MSTEDNAVEVVEIIPALYVHLGDVLTVETLDDQAVDMWVRDVRWSLVHNVISFSGVRVDDPEKNVSTEIPKDVLVPVRRR